MSQRKIAIKDLKVLVVDDNSTFRTLLVQILNSHGITNILEADDGLPALEMLKKQWVDLVFTDWNMHHMTGLDLVKEIRKNKKWKDVRIIMITVNTTKEEVLTAIKAGANNYIAKPFDRDYILQIIKKVFAYQ